MSIDFSKIKSEDELYDVLVHNKTYRLIKDEGELNDGEKQEVEKLKRDIIQTELLNLSRDDVLGDVDLLKYNIPDNLTPLEKVRWVYINLGKLFSYDYRVASDISYGTEKMFDPYQFIGRYQTCIQISQVLNSFLNSIDGVNSTIIERVLSNVHSSYGNNHVANCVTLYDNGQPLKILLDLTLDLYLIQSDCMTKHFAYEDDGSGTYDIIPTGDIRKMDSKINLVPDETYTDDEIAKVKNEMNSFRGITEKEIIDFRLSLISGLFKRFKGYHEGKQYINLLFKELLRLPYHEYNLYYSDGTGINLKTIYRIKSKNAEKWIVYSNNSGFMSTSKDRIKNILDHGWATNSKTLYDVVSGNEIEEERENEIGEGKGKVK